MEWIKINDEGEVELNSEEVKLVPEMKPLLTLAYNKGKGDFEGRKKTRALTELKYLRLVYSSKSPYRDYSDREKIEEAKKDCEFPTDWKPSPELEALIPKFIKGNRSTEERSLNTVEKFLEKFENHLNNINLDERNASGGLVHDAGKIMTTLEKLPSFLLKIGELKRQISQGIAVAPTSKGDHEIGWMALSEDNTVRKTRIESNEETED